MFSNVVKTSWPSYHTQEMDFLKVSEEAEKLPKMWTRTHLP